MGRSNNKKRSWRRMDTSSMADSAALKSAPDSAIFSIDAVEHHSNSKSLPSKNTFRAAQKIANSIAEHKADAKQSRIFDIWAESASKPYIGKRPIVLATSEAILAGVAKRGLQPAHPGTSYNPTIEDQQNAVALAYDIYMKEIKPELIWTEKMEQARVSVVGTEEIDDTDSDEIGEKTIVINAPVRAENRLTKAVRNKRRRHKILMAEVASRKQQKLVIRQIDSIHDLVITKPGAKKPLKSTRTIQLGKHKVKPEFPAVLLSEEITNNLRDVEFQSTILRDTYLNLQRKGFIEARQKVKKTLARVKLYSRYKDRD